MTEKYNYELTQVTVNKDADKPGIYIELSRAYENYKSAETSFDTYVKQTGYKYQNSDAVINNKADFAILNATSGELESIGRYESLSIDEANLIKKKAIEAIDSEKFEVLNTLGRGAFSSYKKLLDGVTEEVVKFYRDNKNRYENAKSKRDKTYLRDMSRYLVLSEGYHVEDALDLIYQRDFMFKVNFK